MPGMGENAVLSDETKMSVCSVTKQQAERLNRKGAAMITNCIVIAACIAFVGLSFWCYRMESED